MTSVSKPSASTSPLAICSRRKVSYSPVLGSTLKSLPLTISIGGISLWMALAITDLAVPREPAITTPPTDGLTPHSSSAVLIASCPTTPASGYVAGPLAMSVIDVPPTGALSSWSISSMASFARSSASVGASAITMPGCRLHL
jgi:hypothetical protein